MNKHLFVDISSHGYGHLAISAPVLNRLAESAPELRLTVRSGLPLDKLRERIQAPFTHIADSSDFGCVMHSATQIDRPATAALYRTQHADWALKVRHEARFLASRNIDLVLSNVSYLPLAGAAVAGIPALAFCSLNWADIFSHYFGRESWAATIRAEILAAYRSAGFLRLTPGMPMPNLAHARAIGPIARIGKRHDLGLNGLYSVLVSMGGIAHRLPLENWPRLPGVRWLVSRSWQCTHPDAIAYESFDLDFGDLLCSVDAVLTKPGYGTFTEAACNGIPVLHVRRDDWPEQDCLIDWLKEHGQSREVSPAQLEHGMLHDALAELRAKPLPAGGRPRNSGIDEAATAILTMLRNASRNA